MSACLKHRGPDAEGIWLAPGVGLAHQRLAIIDLSPAGIQPMSDVSGKLHIVFNGEIYNYLDLRIELEKTGATFRSHSDTEVILEGYRAWGTDVLQKLRGMFAFALWNETSQELLLARDRIGKKPLFFTQTSDGLAFASELKALAPSCPLKPDWDAVRLFLGLQYVPSPRTGFENIFQLEPGHFGIWKSGEWCVSPYVGAGFKPALPADRHAEWPNRHAEWAGLKPAPTDQSIRTLLDEAVRLRMLASDVPVGAFLSGGVDSAAVVAYATKYVDKLQTFTMGFEAPDMDERSEARELAAHFKTDHHEFLAKPEDLLAHIDEIVAHYDAPYADSSALPLWLLARETSKNVKVVLTGDGGDELFGGYRRYSAYERAQEISHYLGAAWFARNMRKVGTWMHDANLVRMGRTIETARTTPTRAYGTLFCGSYFDDHDLAKYFLPEFLAQTASANAVDYVADHMGGGALNFDLTSYLPDDLNVKMDRATMRFGLEARAPFLDQELVAFAQSLPIKEKVSHGKTKIALKRALHGVVPENVLTRSKRGFQVPLAEWFRGPLAKPLAERVLDPMSPLASIVNLEAVKDLIAQNVLGADHGNRLWMLLVLSSWLNRYAK